MESSRSQHDEEKQAFLQQSQSRKDIITPRPRPTRNVSGYLRLAWEITMGIAIVVLLGRQLSDSCIRTIRTSPVPTLPRKIYTFNENTRYLNEDMFATREDTLHTLHNWIELSANARGYIVVGDADRFQLSDPYITQVNHTHQGPAYMMSVFHQLHCLSYIVQHYQAGYGGVKLTQEVAYHSAHCFDYLRQSIMCAADTSLEGMTEAGPGWGSEHECTDYEALLEWANNHGALRWKGILPDEAVL